MRQKCIAIWALTTVTFISLIHLIEAITAIMFNNPIRLLQLYPFIGESLKTIAPQTYLYITATTTVILWGITCLIAFHNPVELYLNRRETTEIALQDKGEILDRVCETVESDHQKLTQLTDIVHKIQKSTACNEQTPKPTTTITPPKETASAKNKPVKPKITAPKTSTPTPAKAIFTAMNKAPEPKIDTPKPVSKPAAQPKTTVEKTRKMPQLLKKQKVPKKKTEKQQTKIDTHRPAIAIHKMK
jgi:hypothetical protein